MSRKALSIIFLLTGLLAGLPQIFPALQPFSLPLLAVLYLATSIYYREVGLLIPAGVLTGLALGIGFEVNPISAAQPEGAAFFLGFAAGWVLIAILSVRFGTPMRWAWIPAGILGLFGIALLTGSTGEALLAILGRYWPLIFVFIGLGILLKHEEAKR